MKKFSIPRVHVPKPPTSTNKSIRFPNEVIAQVEEAIRGTDCNFSAFVIEATRVALENLKEEEESLEKGPAETEAKENLR